MHSRAAEEWPASRGLAGKRVDVSPRVVHPRPRGSSAGADQWLELQRSAGNAAVAGLREDVRSPERPHGLSALTAFDGLHKTHIQRLTVGYTRAHLGHAMPPTPYLAQQIMEIVHSRDGMTNNVKAAVDAYGDGPAVGPYRHHVPYTRIEKKIKNLLQGEPRENIIEWLSETVGNLAGAIFAPAIDPTVALYDAAFNSWLDSCFVAICDWPGNIFRGPSSGDARGTAIDVPTAPTPALTARLAQAQTTLAGLRLM